VLVNIDRHCIRSLALDRRFHSTRRSRNSITCERVQNVSDGDGNGRESISISRVATA
jgi:hypothetical protein